MPEKGVLKKGAWIFLLLIALGPWKGMVSAQVRHSPTEPPGDAGEVKAREAGTVTLDELLRTARERNPAIKASLHAAQAKKTVIPAARTLPDPMIILQSMGDPIPGKLMAGDPSSARIVGVEQEIPFPGKLGLKGKIAEVDAEVEELNHTQVYRQVTSDLKQGYYDLFVIWKSMEIVQRNKDLVQDLQDVAQQKYQVGQGIQQDVLKAQVEISKLIDRLVVLDQRRSVVESKINALLYRPSDTPVGVPAEFPKADLKYSLEELTRMAEANSTALQAKDREVDSKQWSVKLAEREFYPDFSMGFSYYDREDTPEMYAWMVKVKVPIYFWRKQRPELDAAKSSLMSARRMRESTESSIQSQIKESYVMASTADRLVRLYGDAIVPQANLSLESAVSNYQVGRTDFLNLIDSLTALLEFRIKYYESLRDFQKGLAQMEPLTGVELTSN